MDSMLRSALRASIGLRQQLEKNLLGDDGDTWEAELKKFLRREPCWAKGVEPNLRFDRRKDGLELLEHKPRTITAVSDLKLVPFLRDNEKLIRGYDLISRARYELDANYGQEDAEFLLEHQEEIPAEFRQFYLPFTATIWRQPDGDLFVAYLNFRGGRWGLGWGRLGGGFVAGGRLLRPRRK